MESGDDPSSTAVNIAGGIVGGVAAAAVGALAAAGIVTLPVWGTALVVTGAAVAVGAGAVWAYESWVPQDVREAIDAGMEQAWDATTDFAEDAWENTTDFVGDAAHDIGKAWKGSSDDPSPTADRLGTGPPRLGGAAGSLAGVLTLLAILGVAVAGGILVWLLDPAPAIKTMGAVALVALASASGCSSSSCEWSGCVSCGWRSTVSARFAGAAETRGVLGLLGVAGIALLAAWGWTLVSVTSTDVPILTLLLVPIVAALLVYGGVRAWLGGDGAHVLTLRPDGLTLKIPRSGVNAPWTDVSGARLVDNRVQVSLEGGGAASFAARDLASDPVILAELITYYARVASARADIGEGTLAVLRSGEF
jgi:hypothetical protein